MPDKEKEKAAWLKRKQKQPKDTSFCLVSIGKHSLTDLMAKVKTPEEEVDVRETMWLVSQGELPPRYRPQRLCSDEEKQAFIEFQEWLKGQFTGETK